MPSNIDRLIHFNELRKTRLPFGLCASMSGAHRIFKLAAKYAGLFVIAISCLYLMSSAANSANESADNRAAAKLSQQAEYIAGLERIVAACLSDATGKPVQIGGVMHLCGIVRIE